MRRWCGELWYEVQSKLGELTDPALWASIIATLVVAGLVAIPAWLVVVLIR